MDSTSRASSLLAISHHGHPDVLGLSALPLLLPLFGLALGAALLLAPSPSVAAPSSPGAPSSPDAPSSSVAAPSSPGAPSSLDAQPAPLPAGAPAAAAASTAATPGAASSASRYSLRPSLMAGLLQWTLFGGGNVAGQVKVKRLVFEYSHGQALHYDRFGAFAQTEAERDAGVEVESPWTTGGGVGFQITPNLHVLVELKAHHYLVRDTTGDSIEYTTFTAGPGLFYDLYLTKNLFVQPNVRWWPTLASTYDADEATLMSEDGSAYRHARHDLLPFVNVNVGWTFDGR